MELAPRHTIRHGIGAIALGAAVALTLAGCGDSESATSAPTPTDTASAPPAEAAAPDSNESSEAEAAADDEPALSSGLDGLGSSLERTLGGVVGYTAEGDTLIMEFDPEVLNESELPSACMMVEQLANSLTLPEGSSAQVVLGDATLDCDI